MRFQLYRAHAAISSMAISGNVSRVRAESYPCEQVESRYRSEDAVELPTAGCRIVAP